MSVKGLHYGTNRVYEEKAHEGFNKSFEPVSFKIDEKGAVEMGRRSRGTPRIANRLLKRVRDYAQIKADGIIDEEVAQAALDMLEVDRYGLDKVDRLILETVREKFDGGPVGLDTLAAAIGEDAGTIEDVYEPFLIKNGFINRTPKGRVATDLAFKHLSRLFNSVGVSNFN